MLECEFSMSGYHINVESNQDTLIKVTHIFKALSDFNRVRIMEFLENSGSKCWTYFTFFKYDSIKCITSIETT